MSPEFTATHLIEYSSNLLSYLVRQNWKVVQLNPLSVANFKKAQSLRRTKTDKNDVRYIAEMMLSDRNKPYQEQEYHICVLKSITRARYRISKELQHIKGRFRRSLHLLFPEYPKLFGVLYRGAALDLLAEYIKGKDMTFPLLSPYFGFDSQRGDHCKYIGLCLMKSTGL